MALTATTVAASSIATTSARLNGTAVESTAWCCTTPCCSVTERFFHGTSSPPGTSVTAGYACEEPLCSSGVSFNYTVSGLTKDTTHYFQARLTSSSCCVGSSSGSILNFKTLADVMTITAVAAATPGDTTCQVSCTFNPNTVTSTASIKAQYKLDTEPTVWTDGPTISGLSGTTGVSRSFSLTGLTAATLYDFRYVATRNAQNNNSLTSSEGAFTTAASAQTTTGSETETTTDAFTATITGAAVLGAENVDIGVGEQVILEINSTDGEDLSGVWFYHFPTQSYWFWTLGGFSAVLAGVDGLGADRTWIAIGSNIYWVDDETYPFDDLDQTRPIDEAGEFEAPLSISLKTVDMQGAYARPLALDAKIGAVDPLDPPASMQIEVTADVYPGTETRRLLGSRDAELAPNKAGIDEWRRYGLGRLRPANVVGLRLSFPRNQTPRRVNRIVLNELKMTTGLTGLRRRRH